MQENPNTAPTPPDSPQASTSQNTKISATDSSSSNSNSFSVDSLLADTSSQPALSVMSLLNHKTSAAPQSSPRIQQIPAVAIRRPRTPQQPVTKAQAPLPQRIELIGSDNEPWYLRCFCEIKTELGFMIQCEKCLNWQHSHCVNINQSTLPSNYTCPICAQKFIRCRCNENMKYSIPLVRCSKCGYYCHRKCEGLGPGPYFPANHICYNCSPNDTIFSPPPDVQVPLDFFVKNQVVSITKHLLDSFYPGIFTSPIAPILTEFINHDLSLYKFCENVYNRNRPFFYLTHPSNSNFYPKKRRNDVQFSFFRAIFYVLDILYKIPQDTAVAIFNSLALQDIYQPFTLPATLLTTNTNYLEFSDPAKADFDKNGTKTTELSQVSLPNDLYVKNGSLYTASALQPEQLIGIANGFVGLVDEFNYDKGSDYHFYGICGSTTTKYVLDARKSGGQILHNFRRSLSSNCMLKFFKFNQYTYVGIFAGVSDVNGIVRRTRRERFPIPADTELTLPIDFAPAANEDPSDFMSWHMEEIESQGGDAEATSPLNTSEKDRSERATSSNGYSGTSLSKNSNINSLSTSGMGSPGPKHSRPSREERDDAATLRQYERTKKKNKKEEKELKKEKLKKKQDKRFKNNNTTGNFKGGPKSSDVIEPSLFSMINQRIPDLYLFELQPNEEEDNEDERLEDAAITDRDIFEGEIETEFLDQYLTSEIRPFTQLNLDNPINEITSMLDLDGYQ